MDDMPEDADIYEQEVDTEMESLDGEQFTIAEPGIW